MTGSRRTAVPDRVRWALDVLDPQPADAILEVGGGPGVLAGLICARLVTGRLLAVDRSAVAVARTSARNADHLASGRLAVRQCALDALDVPPDSFDKALTLNVNLFWTSDPRRELDVLSRALRPGGTLHVLFGAGPTGGGEVTPVVSAALHAAGFTDVTPVSAAAGSGVSARAPGWSRDQAG